MTTVSGVDFLKSFILFVTQNEERIKSGSLKCALNPSCLRYLNHVIMQNEKGQLDPQIAKKVKREDILDLKFFFEQLRFLKIEPTIPDDIEKRGEIDLSLFSSLRGLEIRQCKPHLISNLYELSLKLTSVQVVESINSIDELLDVEGESPWRKLDELNCSHNFLPAIDNSAHTLTKLQKLDLSHNMISKLANIQYCINMVELDLSFNRLTSMVHCNELIGNIRVLLLRNNNLESTEGLEKLYSLEHLDLADNAISSLEEGLRLRNLPFLESIWLAGNPLSYLDDFRITVFSYYRDGILLDGQEPTPEERKKIHREEVEKAAPPPASAPLHSPVKKSKKKGPKKRIADIQEVTNKTPVITRKKEEIAKVTNFQEKVETLYKEAGASWIVILNEMQEENEKERQIERQKEKEELKKKRMSKIQTGKFNIDDIMKEGMKMEEEEEDALSSPIATTPPSNTVPSATNSKESVLPTPTEEGEETEPEDHPQTPAPPTTVTVALNQPPERSRARHAASTPPRVDLAAQVQIAVEQTTAPPPIAKAQSTRNVLSLSPPKSSKIEDALNQAEHGTEEFYVEARNSLGNYDERIIVISEDLLVEADVVSAIDVLKLALKHLVKVEDVTKQFSSSKPIVQLEFRVSLTDRTQHTICIYQMENEHYRDQILKLLQPIVQKNKKERKIKCLNCGTIYDTTEFKVMEECTKCKSKYIVEVEESKLEQETKKPDQSKNGSAATTEQQEKKKVEEEEWDISKDLNLQLELRMNFFKGGKDEKFVTLFQTNYTPNEKNLDDEREYFLLVSNRSLYILNQQRKKTDKDSGLGLVASYKLHEIRRVVSGLFFQSLRIEISETLSYVFVTRNHARTHKFVEALSQTIRACEGLFDPAEICNKNMIYLANIVTQVLNGMPPKLYMYAMLFQKTKGSTWKGTPPAGSALGTVAPRTLIITEDEVLLCDEDYARWPPSGYPSAKLPTSSQFTLKASHKITDVIALEVDLSQELAFTIIFEEEDASGEYVRWELVASGKHEKKNCMKVLSKRWKALFKLDLAISTKKL